MYEESPRKYLNVSVALKFYYFLLYSTIYGKFCKSAIIDLAIEFGVSKRTAMRILDHANSYRQNFGVLLEINKTYKGKLVLHFILN